MTKSKGGRPRIREKSAAQYVRMDELEKGRLQQVARFFPDISMNQFVLECLRDGLQVRLDQLERELVPESVEEACRLASSLGWHVGDDGVILSPVGRPALDQQGRFTFAGVEIDPLIFMAYQTFGEDGLSVGVTVTGDLRPSNLQLRTTPVPLAPATPGQPS